MYEDSMLGWRRRIREGEREREAQRAEKRSQRQRQGRSDAWRVACKCMSDGFGESRKGVTGREREVQQSSWRNEL
jgi:hypothetical protein